MTEEPKLCFRTPSAGRPRSVFLVLIPEPWGKVSLRPEVPVHTCQRGLHRHNPVTCVCSGPDGSGQECSLGFQPGPSFRLETASLPSHQPPWWTSRSGLIRARQWLVGLWDIVGSLSLGDSNALLTWVYFGFTTWLLVWTPSPLSTFSGQHFRASKTRW